MLDHKALQSLTQVARTVREIKQNLRDILMLSRTINQLPNNPVLVVRLDDDQAEPGDVIRIGSNLTVLPQGAKIYQVVGGVLMPVEISMTPEQKLHEQNGCIQK